MLTDRCICLDTETTGLEMQEHRIIEIGAVEIQHRRLTGKRFHAYINPEREVEVEAQAVHGLSNAFLADKPRFAEIAEAFLQFVRDAELVIHNAPFDLGFLNAELARLEHGALEPEYGCQVCDSLQLARRMHPGQKNGLDALCKRYGVDNSSRTLHGALLDAELLADVYLRMTSGQDSLLLDTDDEVTQAHATTLNPLGGATTTQRPKVLQPTDEELTAHRHYLERMKAQENACLWLET